MIMNSPLAQVVDQSFPLTQNQTAIWLDEALFEQSPMYNIGAFYEIQGKLNVGAFLTALQQIIAGHDVFGLHILHLDGIPPRQYFTPQSGYEPPFLDFSGQPNPAQACKAWLEAEFQEPFDLNQPPFYQFALLKAGEEHYFWLMKMHHLLIDGWGYSVLTNKLVEYYDQNCGKTPKSTHPTFSYQKYIVEEANYYSSEQFEKDRNYWLSKFTALPLPLREAKSVQAAKEQLLPVRKLKWVIPRSTYQKLEAVAKAEGGSAFHFWLAILATYFYRTTRQEQICIGVPVLNRSTKTQKQTIGLFTGMSPLLVEVDAACSFGALLQQIRNTLRQDYRHQRFPIQELMRSLSHLTLGERSLFQLSFSYMVQDMSLSLEDTTEQFNILTGDKNKIPLDIWLRDYYQDRDVELDFYFLPDYFALEEMEQIIARLGRITEAILESPTQALSTIDLLPPAEQNQIVETFNATAQDFPSTDVIAQLFERQATLTPDQSALLFESRTLSYQELNEKANQLAHYLRQHYHIQANDIVALYLQRSEWTIIGILATLKAGAAYLPISTDFPEARVQYMLENSQAKVLLSDAAHFIQASSAFNACPIVQLADSLLTVESKENPERINGPEDLAYVLYTSGSTGQPKGVSMPQGSLINLIHWQNANSTLVPGDRTAQFVPYTFDVSFQEIFATLSAGGTLVVLPQDIQQQLTELPQIIERYAINRLFLPFVGLQQLAELSHTDCAQVSSLKEIITAGEQLQSSTAIRQLLQGLPNCVLKNQYGPTEAHVVSEYILEKDPTQWAELPPIGKPISNVELLILDPAMQVVPIGVSGELYIGGVALARGYLNNPELSAEKFIAHPFHPACRLYKTGDLAQWLPDGNIQYLGRIDNQLKIRGYRIEIGEVEQVLLTHEAIQTCAVVAHSFQNTKELVAYLIPKTGARIPSIEALRQYLSAQLPDYMIPGYFVELSSFPMTSSGKVDRKALPAPDTTTLNSGVPQVAPRNELEATLLGIWEEVLERNAISVLDNFFSLGGHSLRAIRVMSLIKQRLHRTLRLADLFSYPSIAELADVLKVTAVQADDPYTKTIPALPEQASYALSHAQQRLWIISQINDTDAAKRAYNLPLSVRINGQLKVPVLSQALTLLAQRHETLRTRFVVENTEVRQIIDAPVAPVSLCAELISAHELPTLLENFAQYPFNLEQEHPWRLRLLKLDQEAFLLLLNIHHIVSDAWSMEVLMAELRQLYSAIESNLANPLVKLNQLPIQYKEYATWHTQLLTRSDQLNTLRNYWTSQLSNLPKLELPLDHPRPAQKSYHGASLQHTFSRTQLSALQALANQEGVSLFMLLTAVLKVLLYRYTQQEDLVVGTPSAGRNHPDLQSQIGFFVNTLVLRNQVEPNTSFLAFLANIKNTILAAFEHEHYPFDRLVEDLDVTRDLSRTSLVDVLIALHNDEAMQLSLPGLEVYSSYLDTASSKFDLAFNFVEHTQHLSLHLEYNTDVFEAARISRIFVHLEVLLQSILADPNCPLHQLSILDSTEQNLLASYNNTAVEYPSNETFVQWFEQQVGQTPDQIALAFGKKQLTYTELNEKANQIAHNLRKNQEIDPNDVIAVQMERSEWMIIAILGVLKAGAAYLPLAHDLPAARMAFMLEDSQAKLLLCDDNRLESTQATFGAQIRVTTAQQVSFQGSSANPELVNFITDLAYVIYTSGSTGKPKGVAIAHASLANYLHWCNDYYFAERPSAALPLFASIAFDMSITTLFSPLVRGGAIVIYPEGETADHLKQIFHLASGIKVLKATPSHIDVIAALGLTETGVEQIIVGGEALLDRQVQTLLRLNPGIKIHNEYGPTEATVGCTIATIDLNNQHINIGHPIANTEILILDAYDHLAPLGCIGELAVAGSGLATGYLNNPELSAEKFVAHPFKAGERLYKTGDLARWQADGQLEYLGRIDHQVKVRGYRIETGEIEQVLAKHPAIQSSVVVAVDTPEGKELAAYLVAAENTEKPTTGSIQQFLGQSLPEYMVPGHYVVLDSLPIAASGKIDRKALPALSKESLSLGTPYEAARTPLEQQLCKIWAQVLHREQIGVFDNFFSLGGHSLRAVRLVTLVQQEMGIKLALSDVFAQPNIAQLAEKLQSQIDQGLVKHQPIQPLPPQDYYELSNAQRRLWFIDQMQETTASARAYNIPLAVYMQGELRTDILAQAFRQLVARHEILRTRLVLVAGEPQQVIDPIERVPTLLVEKIDDLVALENLKKTQAYQHFDLEKELAFACKLLQLAPDQHVLLLTLHHIIADGWSIEVMLQELGQLYRAGLANQSLESFLPVLPIQYKDFAAWQKKSLYNEANRQKLRHFWQETLKNLPTLDFPADLPRPAVKSYTGASFSSSFSARSSQQLLNIAAQHNSTLFTTLTALLKVLIYRYTRQTDLVIGTPSAGRNHPDLNQQIGFYVNTVVLRNDISGKQSFASFLETVKKNTLAAFEHEEYPFDQIVEDLDLPRDLSRSPIVDIMMVLHNQEEAQLDWPNLNLNTTYTETDTSKFDLSFNFKQAKDLGIQLYIEYNSDLFYADRVERMLLQLECLIESIATQADTPIDHLPILPASEKQLLLQDFNNTAADYPKQTTLVSLFEAQVAKTPDNIALGFEGKNLSYAELNELANQWAHQLRHKYNIQADDIIAIQLERSEWLLVGILAVLKAGAAYLPVGPDLPAARVQFMLQDCACKALLTDESTLTKANSLKEFIPSLGIENIATNAPTSVSKHNPEPVNQPKDLAYIIYTSGSTGNPKGVMIEHRNVVRLMFNEHNRFDFNDQDVWTLFHYFGFDFSVWEIWGALLFGGKVVVVPKEIALDPELFANLILEEKVTVLNQVPSTFEQVRAALLEKERRKPEFSLRYIIFGGAPLLPSTLSTFHEVYPQVRLINMYGITETTVHVTFKEITALEIREGISNVGKPIPTLCCYILDEFNELMPIGTTGEICVSGLGLARGYLNNPALTEAKFVPHPFKAGERLYKSGDLARILATGDIEHLGRIDHQLKIRGYRIEAGEVEQALLSHDAVHTGTVIGMQIGGNTELVAYLVPKAGQALPEVSDLRSYLGRSLPDYMIPAYFVALEDLPLTTNGKVDRRALPAPEQSALSASVNYLAPRNALEATLVKIWEQVLERQPIGVLDEFFGLGGHSLRAVRIVALIQQELSLKIKLGAIFAHPTIAALAAHIQAQGELGIINWAHIPALAPHAHYALSNAQRRLWVLHQMSATPEGRTAYNIAAAAHLEGPLQVKVLEQALGLLSLRHESLRTRFISLNGEAVQVIDPGMASFDLRLQVVAPQEVDAAIQAHAQKVFNLEKEHLLDLKLLQIHPEDHFLLFNMHHIVADGWSISVMLRELSHLYEACLNNSMEPIAPLPNLTIQYKDFAAWQNGLLEEETSTGKLREYWQAKLHNLPTLELPLDFPRPLVMSYRGASVQYTFPPKLSQALDQYAKEHGSTLFIALTTLINTLLYRYTHQDDIVLGTPTAGRNHADLHQQIGLYVNTLALRNQIDGTRSFAALLEAVKVNTLEAFEHELYPFDRLVGELEIARDMSRSAVFDVMLVLQNNEEIALKLPQVKATPIRPENCISKFDLTFTFQETPAGLELDIEYATDLFKGERIERMFGHLEQLINSALSNDQQAIDQLEILPPAEKQLLLYGFNQTQVEFDHNRTVVQLLEDRAAQTPDALALVFGHRQYTYAQLNQKINQLGHYLRQTHHLQANDVVALQLERSEWMVIALLGVLKAGAAYLPIASDTPETRVSFILQDSRAKVLLTDDRTFAAAQVFQQQAPTLAVENIESSKLFPAEIQQNLSPLAQMQDLAYIIYTSGSTGNPKGVMIEHASLSNFVHFGIKAYGIEAEDRVLQAASYTFDTSIEEIFCTLIAGAALFVIDKETLLSTRDFLHYLNNHRISILDLTPALLGTLNRAELPYVRTIITGGDAADRGDVLYYAQRHQYINGYGPTEGTITSSTYWVDPNTIEQLNSIPIGKPNDNAQIFILTDGLQLQPIGVAGELCIGGLGIARGYLNNPELSAEKFIQHPFTPGERLYKTGDLARWLSDGNIEYLGRKDFQVKIRGYRVETGEIEQVLLAHEGVQTCVVLAHEMDGLKELVTYWVPRVGQSELEATELQQFLEQRLPDYMVPAYFVRLDALPLTPNGKIDRRALSAPTRSTSKGATTVVAPRTSLEDQVLHIWQQVLGREHLSIHDNFFRVGGHSLRAVRLVSLLQQQLKAEVKLGDIFTYPSIAELAGRIADLLNLHPLVLKPIPVVPTQASYDLSHAQLRLWVLSQLSDHEKAAKAYNIPGGFRIVGALNVAALEQGLKLLLERHEMLRTRFVTVDGLVQQVIDPVPAAFSLDVALITEAELPSAVQEHAEHIFDLHTEPLFKASLLAIHSEEHVLLLNFHHIIVDGWSMSLLFQELSTLYEACVAEHPQPLATLPNLRIQYKDYSAWQNELLANDAAIGDLRQFWQQTLSDLPVLELPTDFPRPAVMTYNGANVQSVFSNQLLSKLQDIAEQQGATLFMTLTALVNVLLYRYSQQTDMVIGTPSAGRVHPDLYQQLGFYVNTVVLRNKIDTDSNFFQFLAQVKTNALRAFEHELYPFDRLVEELDIPRDLSRSAVFDVTISLQNPDDAALKLGELEIQEVNPQASVSKFDLNFGFAATPQGLQLDISYNPDLFKAERITRMSDHLECLVQSIIDTPEASLSRLNLLPAAERDLVFTQFNQTQVPFPQDKTMVECFEQIVAQQPLAQALWVDGLELTYQQLNERANQLAHALRTQFHIRPNEVVAIQVDRSANMIIGMLGILKAGAAYLPVSKSLPLARFLFTLTNSEARALLSDEVTLPILQELQQELPQLPVLTLPDFYQASDYPVTNPIGVNSSTDLAYVIYTSGSTGQPKGVMVEHRNFINILHAYPLAGHRCSLTCNFVFDVSVLEIFGALLAGAALCIPTLEQTIDAGQYAEFLYQQRISQAYFHPFLIESTAQHLSSYPEVYLRQLLIGVEPIQEHSILWYKEKGVKILNGYGPTETTIFSTLYTVDNHVSLSNGKLPIGKPIDNTEILILDSHDQLQPIGIAGELCIAGSGLTRGYLNSPDLTAAKFVAHPFKEGEKIYRTGDLSRWDENGDIEFLGRIDQQLKIRGHRIEASEIELTLTAHPAISSALATAKEIDGQKELVAYLIPAEGAIVPDFVPLRSLLAANLPDYMVPRYFVTLDAYPLNNNGKIDRKMLPLPQAEGQDSECYEAPSNAIEQHLVDIWEQVLERQPIGIHDNFFQLGGHSLRAVRVVTLIRQELAVELKLSHIFAHPSIAELVRNTEELRLRALLFGLNSDQATNSKMESKTEEVW